MLVQLAGGPQLLESNRLIRRYFAVKWERLTRLIGLAELLNYLRLLLQQVQKLDVLVVGRNCGLNRIRNFAGESIILLTIGQLHLADLLLSHAVLNPVV